jgi:hypothetical protein
MRARYTRLFSDSRSATHFEDLEIGLTLGFAVPPAEPLHQAQCLPAEGPSGSGHPPLGKVMCRTPLRVA